MLRQTGNLGPAERWFSIIAGLGLTLASFARGSGTRRALTSIAGLSLLSRGAAGHCGMKAALTGEAPLKEGLRDQWSRMRSGLSGVTSRMGDGGLGLMGSGAKGINSMEGLYTAELQELHSAESQLCMLLESLGASMQNEELERELRGYGTEVRSRREDLERILSSTGANPRAHPDQGMQALLRETRKMTQVSASSVRTAALISSLQRLLHYKIAGYGTVATYANTLGRVEDAARLAEYADRDKGMDERLSSIAKGIVNVQARIQPEGGAEAASRPH